MAKCKALMGSAVKELNIGDQLRFWALTAGACARCRLASLPAPKVQKYLPLSILIPSRHHSRTFAEICMQNLAFCCIFGSQYVKCGLWLPSWFLEECLFICEVPTKVHWRLWKSTQEYCLKTEIPNIQISKHKKCAVNFQHTFLVQQHKTHNKYNKSSSWRWETRTWLDVSSDMFTYLPRNYDTPVVR